MNCFSTGAHESLILRLDVLGVLLCNFSIAECVITPL
jgi:hypothetical protein